MMRVNVMMMRVSMIWEGSFFFVLCYIDIFHCNNCHIFALQVGIERNYYIHIILISMKNFIIS